MTEKNLLPTEEQILADKTAQAVKKAFRIVAVLIGGASIASATYFFFAWQLGAWQMYALGFDLALFIPVAIVAIQKIRVGRVETSGWMLITAMLVIFLASVFLVSNVGWLFGLILVALVFVTATQTLDTKGRRQALFAGIVVGVLMMLADLLPLSYRLLVPQVQAFAPTLAVIMLLVSSVFIAREAWNRNNIRSRFLTFSLGLTLLAAVLIAGVSVSSLFSAGRNAQETSSQVLRKQSQETLEYQTAETAIQNDLTLQGISRDAQDVARQTAYILGNPGAFNTEAFWKADGHMFFGPEGQYINGEGDVSTVFVPNTVEVNDFFKRRLELLAYLDMALVPVYESDPNSVAIYFVGKDEVSWLYPNINLGAIVSADYLATQDIFYTAGAPENNPERQVVWTPVYDDPGGQGLLVSAIAPVYSGNTFMGVIGIDVSLAGLTATIEAESSGAGEGSYAFMLDTEGRTLALPEQGYDDLLGRGREVGEFGTNLATSVHNGFSPVVADMLAGETGFQNVIVDDQEFFVAYTTLESTGWRIASVARADQVLAPVTALQTELEEGSSALIFQRVLPVGIAITLLVVIAGIFFTNRLVDPIEQLTEGAAEIGAGEWETPLPQSELSEISGLSRTLSAMATQLKSTLESLEQRVADRTHNLVLAAEVRPKSVVRSHRYVN